jgi:hypothetical protein
MSASVGAVGLDYGPSEPARREITRSPVVHHAHFGFSDAPPLAAFIISGDIAAFVTVQRLVLALQCSRRVSYVYASIWRDYAVPRLVNLIYTPTRDYGYGVRPAYYIAKFPQSPRPTRRSTHDKPFPVRTCARYRSTGCTEIHITRNGPSTDPS